MKTTNKIHQPLALALRFFYTGNCALLVCAFAAAQSSRLPKRRVSRWKHSEWDLTRWTLSIPRGINNTAVGTGALTADTTGAFNVAIGNGALQSNTTGVPKHGHWGGSAQPKHRRQLQPGHWFSSALHEHHRQPISPQLALQRSGTTQPPVLTRPLVPLR